MSRYNRPALDIVINRKIASETFHVLSYTESAATWTAKGNERMADHCKRTAAKHVEKLGWLYSKLVCVGLDDAPYNHMQHLLMYAGSKQYRNANDCKEVVDCFVS